MLMRNRLGAIRRAAVDMPDGPVSPRRPVLAPPAVPVVKTPIGPIIDASPDSPPVRIPSRPTKNTPPPRIIDVSTVPAPTLAPTPTPTTTTTAATPSAVAADPVVYYSASTGSGGGGSDDSADVGGTLLGQLPQTVPLSQGVSTGLVLGLLGVSAVGVFSLFTWLHHNFKES